MQDNPAINFDRNARLGAIEYEILEERARALHRVGARAERALEALRAHDGSQLGAGPEREELVAAAGEALWYFVVQRESCGMRDTAEVLREWRVPREVQLQMRFRPSAERR